MLTLWDGDGGELCFSEGCALEFFYLPKMNSKDELSKESNSAKGRCLPFPLLCDYLPAGNTESCQLREKL